MEIYIDNRQDEINFDESIFQQVERAIYTALEVEGRDRNYEISISFVTNDEIRTLNKEYRGIDSVTDVLSFPMDDDFGIGVPFLGDIIISLERAQDQAKEYGHSIEREIVYLTVHSMFHLMGYDHLSKEDKEEMRKKEKMVMNKLNIYRDKGD